MNGERALLVVVTIACLAAVGWRAAQILAPSPITPPPDKPESDSPNAGPVVAVMAPGSVVNAISAKACPLRLVYGPYMMMPPVIPFASNRVETSNDGYN